MELYKNNIQHDICHISSESLSLIRSLGYGLWHIKSRDLVWSMDNCSGKVSCEWILIKFGHCVLSRLYIFLQTAPISWILKPPTVSLVEVNWLELLIITMFPLHFHLLKWKVAEIKVYAVSSNFHLLSRGVILVLVALILFE